MRGLPRQPEFLLELGTNAPVDFLEAPGAGSGVRDRVATGRHLRQFRLGQRGTSGPLGGQQLDPGEHASDAFDGRRGGRVRIDNGADRRSGYLKEVSLGVERRHRGPLIHDPRQ
jgi:hypothetical protein